MYQRFGIDIEILNFFFVYSYGILHISIQQMLTKDNLCFSQVFDEACRAVLQPQPIRTKNHKCQLLWWPWLSPVHCCRNLTPSLNHHLPVVTPCVWCCIASLSIAWSSSCFKWRPFVLMSLKGIMLFIMIR